MSISLWGLVLVAAVIGLSVWLFMRASRASEARKEALREKLANRQPWAGDKSTGRGTR
ncbi:MAG: hypothetical protein ABI630_09575 [Betaproteobacteria bacterium]